MVSRILSLVAAAVLVFAAVVAIGLKLVPAPRRESDYLVIGAIATLVSMLALFGVLITGVGKSSNVFFKRRAKTAKPVDQPAAGSSAPPEA